MPSAAEMQAAVRQSPMLRRSRGLFLRIGAVVTIALIPIIVFIESTRRESLESRAGTLLDTAALVADNSLRESIADSDMLLKALAMDDQSNSPGEAGTQGRRRWIMQSAIHAHARYSSVRLYSNQGEALLEADRYVPAIAPTPSARRLPAELLTLAKRLSADQAWMSSLLWPSAPRSRGPSQAEPYYLLLRPLVNRKGVHRGILAIVIRLGSVMREMDQILNQAEERQQGYVVSNDGTVLNPSGRARTTNFAITYPELWERLKEKERGRGDSHGKLFLFRRERPLDASVTQSAGFTFGLVMQVQTTGLDHGQGLGRPAEISLVGLLYLVVAGASLAIAAEQEKLAEGRLQEQELHRRS